MRAEKNHLGILRKKSLIAVNLSLLLEKLNLLNFSSYYKFLNIRVRVRLDDK